LKDMKTYEKSAALLQNDRLFTAYPELVTNVLERIFQSKGEPRKKIGRIGWEAAREKVPLADLAADLLKGGKSLI